MVVVLNQPTNQLQLVNHPKLSLELRVTSFCQSKPVNTYIDANGKLKQVTLMMSLDCLCAVVCFIGKDVMGYKANKIGTHSIRFTIMLIGRWTNNAILQYIY
jgi:hypothetical protein